MVTEEMHSLFKETKRQTVYTEETENLQRREVQHPAKERKTKRSKRDPTQPHVDTQDTLSDS